MCEASFEDTSFLHVVDHALSHVALSEDPSWRKTNSFAGRHVLGRIRRARRRKLKKISQSVPHEGLGEQEQKKGQGLGG